MDHKEKIKSLPVTPGVYLMKDISGNVIYVGKAGNIKKRVSTYFYPNRRESERTDALIERIEDISYIQTATEAEALIYENSLIKQLAPKYNVALRDDKSYPLLKLTIAERFPRLFITRQKKKDGSVYYGPYASAKLLREALVILRQIFPLRSCGKLPKNLCLNYHINQCLGPCAEKISDINYGEVVAELKLFLEGKRAELVARLTKKMLEAAEKENFEEAALIKRRIEVLSSIRERKVGYGSAAELEELGNLLGIKGGIDVIEAFDVSNIMGQEAVGSLVYFYKGRPKKGEYKKFLIKTVSGVDDYAMMKEIVRRRYIRLMEERRALPNLILIDGGKGHLAAAREELDRLGLSNIPAIGIAKEFEHIYVKDKKDPIVLPKESKTLHLLERIRDEAHRFAISYHKNLRSRKIRTSELDEIRGIGEKRKRALIGHFGTVDKIKTARPEELLKVKGMNEKAARSIIEYFKK